MERILFLFVFIGFSLNSFGALSAVKRRPTNIVGPTDDRGMVQEIGLNFLSPAEVSQIRNNVGYVYCPGDPKEKRAHVRPGQPRNLISDTYLGTITTTGFLVSKDVIVTVAHAFGNFVGKLRPNLDKCYFQTQGDSPKQYSILPATLRHGLHNGIKSQNDDYAVVRLATPVERANPLVVLTPPAPVSSEDEIFPVTSFRPGGAKLWGDLPHEPLIQQCKVMNLKVGTASRPSKYFSDCDNEPGGSGGPNLARVQGQLVVIGIFSGAGPSELIGKNYSETVVQGEKGVSGFSLSESVLIDSIFLRDIELVIRAAKAAAVEAANAAISQPIIGSAVKGGPQAIAPSGAAVPVSPSNGGPR